MILCDLDIMRAQLDDGIITPFNVDQVQPASYDLTLGPGFKRMASLEEGHLGGVVDPTKKRQFDNLYNTGYHDYTIISQGEFVLVTTRETVNIPPYLVGRVEGKSSLARIGMMVHITAGYIDPGFNGQITLECVNLGPRQIKLTLGMKIAQLTLVEMTNEADRPYGHPDLGSHYQDQEGPTGTAGVGVAGEPESEAFRALNEVFNG